MENYVPVAVVLSGGNHTFDCVESKLRALGIPTIGMSRGEYPSYEALRGELECITRQGNRVKYLIYSVPADRKYENRTIDQLTAEEWEEWKYFSVKYLYDVSRTFVKDMAENGGGKMLMIGSVSGITPMKGQSLVGMASAGAFMAAKSIAAELAKDNVVAEALAIGVSEKGASVRLTPSDRTLIRHIPSGRIMTDEETATEIVRRLTEMTYRTAGNVFAVDAGFSCSYMREW